MKMMQLYSNCKPMEQIDTQWGRITTEEWMAKEVARIVSTPGRSAEIRTEDNGKISLWVDQVAGDEMDRH